MKHLFLAAFLFLGILAYSQPTLMWNSVYNGPPDQGDEAISIAVDGAGNSYVTGSAFAANGSLDMITIKYNPLGQQLWIRSFNGSASLNDQGIMIVLDNVGSVYVTGYSYNLNSSQDITTIKYNTNGVLQWVQFYDGAFSGGDFASGLSVDAGGNVFVTGYETTAGFAFDFITLKYSATGALQWYQTYNGAAGINDETRGIVLDASGNVYVVGSSDTIYNSAPLSTIVLLKYNNAGVLQWRRVYNSPIQAYAFAKKIAIDRNDNIVVVGFGGIPAQGNNMFTFKWDAAGNFQWFTQYNFGPNLYEQPNDVVIDSLNNIIVTGQGIAPSSGSTNDYVTVKYDAAGTQQWAMRYNNIFQGEDRAQAVAVDDSLNVYVTGFSKGTGTNYDIATIKYDPLGNQQYVLRYDNTTANLDDAGNAMVVKNGDIYITGKSSNLTNDDYITLRYSYGIPTAVDENEVALNLDLNVFPNPSHGEVHVVLPGNELENKILRGEILNVSGQIVLATGTLTTETGNGNTFVTMNTSDLPPGIYFVMMYADEEFIGTSKFIAE